MKRENNVIFMEPEEFQNLQETLSKEQKEAFKKYKEEHKDEPIAEISLYDCNRAVMNNMPDLTEKEIKSKTELIGNWFEKYPDRYFMLLCHELNYYTVFHQVTTTFGSFTKMTEELLDLLINHIGHIKTIEIDTNGMIAIWGWQREENENPHCFYLFPYGAGVIEV